MTSGSLLGIDVRAARVLAHTLGRLTSRADEAIATIGEAETLSGLSTATTSRLAEIGGDCAAIGTAITTAVDELLTFRLPLRTGSDRRLDRFRLTPFDTSAFAPYRASGSREFTVGTSRRERWIDVTRMPDDAVEQARAWGELNGLAPDEAALVVAQYRAISADTNEYLLATSGNPFTGQRGERRILETEARRVFIDIELMAATNGWDAATRLIADEALIDHLVANDDNLGWRSSDHNTLQLALAYSALNAKARLGASLPTLTDEELDGVLAAGESEQEFNQFLMQVHETGAAISQISDHGLARGIRLLSSSADVFALIGAAAAGNDAQVRELTADLAAGYLIGRAAHWLLGAAAGPLVAVAALVLALTDAGPPQRGRPPDGPPRVGWTNEYGVREDNGHCMTATGDIDMIACDR